MGHKETEMALFECGQYYFFGVIWDSPSATFKSLKTPRVSYGMCVCVWICVYMCVWSDEPSDERKGFDKDWLNIVSKLDKFDVRYEMRDGVSIVI